MSSYPIREEKPEDHDGIRAMHQLAFGSAAVATLTDNLRESHDTVISLVAVDTDHIVGHIMLSRLQAPMRALTLAPLAVHPDFQGRGIGADLINQSLARARQDGWKAVFVIGGIGYYERLGFSLTRVKGYTSPFAGDHFMVLSFDPENGPVTDAVIPPPSFKPLT